MIIPASTGAARDRILARLRAPIAVSPAPSSRPPPMPPAPEALAPDEAVARFRAGIEAFHAEVLDTRGHDWRRAVADVCAVKQVRTLLLPPGSDLAAWPGGPELHRFDQPIESFKQALFDAVDAGLSFADGAIAETGTLFHADPRGTPRTLSLVPPIHLCILDVRRILPTLQGAVASEGWAAAMPSNLIFITGPSKTADIQQTLAYGAHGPRELIVLLVDGGEGGAR